MSRGAVGSFAARQTTWGRRWPHARPGPLAAPQMGSSLPGVAFLPTFLSGYTFGAYICPGADPSLDPSTWPLVDVSADVLQPTPPAAAFEITRGRFDEQSTTMPAECRFTLINTSGNYTFRRPQSPYFPYMKVGLPVKVFIANTTAVYDRMSGTVTELTAEWDTTGNYAVVHVTVAGVLDRLGQGNSPLKSALTRSIPATNPVAYWTMEDGTSATAAASSVTGGHPMQVVTAVDFSGVPITDATVAFASGGAAGGSDNLPDFSSGGRMLGAVDAGTSSTSWRVEFSTKMSPFDLAGSPYTAMMHIYTSGDVQFFEVLSTRVDLGGVYVDYVNRTGGFGAIVTSDVAIDDGDWHRITVDGSKSGANIVITVYIDGVLGLTTTYTSLAFGRVTNIVVNPGNFYSVRSVQSLGQIAVWAPWSSTVDTAYAGTGYLNETAAARMARLCREEGVPFALHGTDGGRAMGAQGVASLLTLLRECEAVGGGVLEDGYNFGLIYHELESRYNPVAVMTPTLNQVTPALTPVENNQRIRNDVTVSRTGGSSAQYVTTSGPYAVSGAGGIGSIPDTKPLNLPDDTTSYERAGWFAHLGTVDADRYPTLPYNFAARTALIPSWLACANGSRITVASTYANGGAAPDGLIEGWSESLSTFVWAIGANVSPPQPWQVGLIDDATDTGLVGADDAAIAAEVDLSAVSLSVTVGTLWSTSGGDYPVTITVGGERMTLTAVAGGASPQTFTVTRGLDGYTLAHHVGDKLDVFRPLYVAV